MNINPSPYSIETQTKIKGEEILNSNSQNPRQRNWLEDCVKSSNNCFDTLPLFHVCNSTVFKQILRDGFISPQGECKVMKETLVYFFYGRAAYRTDPRLKTYMPGSSQCVIVLNSGRIKSRHIFPFDSGAFEIMKSTGSFPKGADREHYDFTGDTESPSRIVSTYWKSNSFYIMYTPEEGRAPHACNNDYCATYKNIIDGKGAAGGMDDRRGTIEISTNEVIPLTDEYIVAIMLPKKLRVQLDGNEYISKLGKKVMSYSPFLSQPSENQGLMEAESYRRLARMGFKAYKEVYPEDYE